MIAVCPKSIDYCKTIPHGNCIDSAEWAEWVKRTKLRCISCVIVFVLSRLLARDSFDSTLGSSWDTRAAAAAAKLINSDSWKIECVARYDEHTNERTIIIFSIFQNSLCSIAAWSPHRFDCRGSRITWNIVHRVAKPRSLFTKRITNFKTIHMKRHC